MRISKSILLTGFISFILILVSLIANPRIIQPDFEDPSIGKKYAQKETISITTVTLISMLVPMIVFFGCFRCLNLDIEDELQFYIVFLTNFLIVSAIIENLKNLVGRLRPDFIARCVPINGVCTGPLGRIKEGRKSFPSGHTGTSSAGFIFLCLFLNFSSSSDAQTGSRSFRFSKHVISYLMLSIPLAVGLSRYYDNRHFISDILSGAFISTLTSLFLFKFCCLKLIKPRTTDTQIKRLE